MAMAYFKILSQYVPGETEKSIKYFTVPSFQLKIWSWGLLKMKQVC